MPCYCKQSAVFYLTIQVINQLKTAMVHIPNVQLLQVLSLIPLRCQMYTQDSGSQGPGMFPNSRFLSYLAFNDGRKTSTGNTVSHYLCFMHTIIRNILRYHFNQQQKLKSRLVPWSSCALHGNTVRQS